MGEVGTGLGVNVSDEKKSPQLMRTESKIATEVFKSSHLLIATRIVVIMSSSPGESLIGKEKNRGATPVVPSSSDVLSSVEGEENQRTTPVGPYFVRTPSSSSLTPLPIISESPLAASCASVDQSSSSSASSTIGRFAMMWAAIVREIANSSESHVNGGFLADLDHSFVSSFVLPPGSSSPVPITPESPPDAPRSQMISSWLSLVRPDVFRVFWRIFLFRRKTADTRNDNRTGERSKFL